MSGLYQCRDCLYRFEDGESLEDHEDVCPGDTSWSCPACGELVDDDTVEHNCEEDEEDEEDDDE